MGRIKSRSHSHPEGRQIGIVASVGPGRSSAWQYIANHMSVGDERDAVMEAVGDDVRDEEIARGLE